MSARKQTEPKEILGLNRITKKRILELCKRDKLYQTPKLNDVLYLHYQGFQCIECLEDYTELKCLWLECNAISEIQGLENQTKLKCLYLQSNLIRKIENLEFCKELDTINLSQNQIRKIENLGIDVLPVLNTLNIASNYIKDAEGLRDLENCKNLSVLDLSNNRIDDILVVKVFAKMPELKVLVLQGNPVVSKIPQYRKTLILECKKLTYLDQRPVFPKDRACAEAWKRGGYEEERKENERWNRQERRKMRDSVNATIRMRNKHRKPEDHMTLLVSSDSEDETTQKKRLRQQDVLDAGVDMELCIWDEVAGDDHKVEVYASSSSSSEMNVSSSTSVISTTDSNETKSSDLNESKSSDGEGRSSKDDDGDVKDNDVICLAEKQSMGEILSYVHKRKLGESEENIERDVGKEEEIRQKDNDVTKLNYNVEKDNFESITSYEESPQREPLNSGNDYPAKEGLKIICEEDEKAYEESALTKSNLLLEAEIPGGVVFDKEFAQSGPLNSDAEAIMNATMNIFVENEILERVISTKEVSQCELLNSDDNCSAKEVFNETLETIMNITINDLNKGSPNSDRRVKIPIEGGFKAINDKHENAYEESTVIKSNLFGGIPGSVISNKEVAQGEFLNSDNYCSDKEVFNDTLDAIMNVTMNDLNKGSPNPDRRVFLQIETDDDSYEVLDEMEKAMQQMESEYGVSKINSDQNSSLLPENSQEKRQDDVEYSAETIEMCNNLEAISKNMDFQIVELQREQEERKEVLEALFSQNQSAPGMSSTSSSEHDLAIMGEENKLQLIVDQWDKDTKLKKYKHDGSHLRESGTIQQIKARSLNDLGESYDDNILQGENVIRKQQEEEIEMEFSTSNQKESNNLSDNIKIENSSLECRDNAESISNGEENSIIFKLGGKNSIGFQNPLNNANDFQYQPLDIASLTRASNKALDSLERETKELMALLQKLEDDNEEQFRGSTQQLEEINHNISDDNKKDYDANEQLMNDSYDIYKESNEMERETKKGNNEENDHPKEIFENKEEKYEESINFKERNDYILMKETKIEETLSYREKIEPTEIVGEHSEGGYEENIHSEDTKEETNEQIKKGTFDEIIRRENSEIVRVDKEEHYEECINSIKRKNHTLTNEIKLEETLSDRENRRLPEIVGEHSEESYEENIISQGKQEHLDVQINKESSNNLCQRENSEIVREKDEKNYEKSINTNEKTANSLKKEINIEDTLLDRENQELCEIVRELSNERTEIAREHINEVCYKESITAGEHDIAMSKEIELQSEKEKQQFQAEHYEIVREHSDELNEIVTGYSDGRNEIVREHSGLSYEESITAVGEEDIVMSKVNTFAEENEEHKFHAITYQTEHNEIARERSDEAFYKKSIPASGEHDIVISREITVQSENEEQLFDGMICQAEMENFEIERYLNREDFVEKEKNETSNDVPTINNESQREFKEENHEENNTNKENVLMEVDGDILVTDIKLEETKLENEKNNTMEGPKLKEALRSSDSLSNNIKIEETELEKHMREKGGAKIIKSDETIREHALREDTGDNMLNNIKLKETNLERITDDQLKNMEGYLKNEIGDLIIVASEKREKLEEKYAQEKDDNCKEISDQSKRNSDNFMRDTGGEDIQFCDNLMNENEEYSKESIKGNLNDILRDDNNEDLISVKELENTKENVNEENRKSCDNLENENEEYYKESIKENDDILTQNNENMISLEHLENKDEENIKDSSDHSNGNGNDDYLDNIENSKSKIETVLSTEEVKSNQLIAEEITNFENDQDREIMERNLSDIKVWETEKRNIVDVDGKLNTKSQRNQREEIIEQKLPKTKENLNTKSEPNLRAGIHLLKENIENFGTDLGCSDMENDLISRIRKTESIWKIPIKSAMSSSQEITEKRSDDDDECTETPSPENSELQNLPLTKTIHEVLESLADVFKDFPRQQRKVVKSTDSEKRESLKKLVENSKLKSLFNQDTHESLDKLLGEYKKQQEVELKEMVNRVYAQRERYDDTIELIDGKLMIVNRDTGELKELTKPSKGIIYSDSDNNDYDTAESDQEEDGACCSKPRKRTNNKERKLSITPNDTAAQFSSWKSIESEANEGACCSKPRKSMVKSGAILSHKNSWNSIESDTDEGDEEQFYSLVPSSSSIIFDNIHPEFFDKLSFDHLTMTQQDGDHIVQCSRSYTELKNLFTRPQNEKILTQEERNVWERLQENNTHSQTRDGTSNEENKTVNTSNEKFSESNNEELLLNKMLQRTKKREFVKEGNSNDKQMDFIVEIKKSQDGVKLYEYNGEGIKESDGGNLNGSNKIGEPEQSICQNIEEVSVVTNNRAEREKDNAIAQNIPENINDDENIQEIQIDAKEKHKNPCEDSKENRYGDVTVSDDDNSIKEVYNKNNILESEMESENNAEIEKNGIEIKTQMKVLPINENIKSDNSNASPLLPDENTENFDILECNLEILDCNVDDAQFTKDLHHHAYKVKLAQELKPADHGHRRDLDNLPINSPSVERPISIIMASSISIWDEENFCVIHEKQIHPQRVTVSWQTYGSF
ncbi:dynein axonemal assembly factor 1 homolog [Musca vetustissima]|uniref:dynein axonemal assembly factor 1 homolog n=1 Tax=Musca vetustissima TaxID=27455 RepID=UPI002AB65A8D|nr:dynein axonemal assembly factor 1 homolog [Musca vetustissima]